jgi:hypothetical protein
VRPSLGVSIELLALTVVFSFYFILPLGPFYLVYTVVAQLLATYLVHCPAHYMVGRVSGIRFRGIRLGRTTLSRVLPARLKGVASLVPIPTLSTDKSSLSQVSRSKVSAMYLSGAVASSASAVAVAVAVTPGGPLPLVAISWAVAIGYLLFDLVYSPKSGDVKRARAFNPP